LPPTPTTRLLTPTSTQALKDFGAVDILVSNAAVNPAFGLFLDVYIL